LFWRIRGKFAARQGPWKLNHTDRENPLLYNLYQDIGETKDLSKRYPERVSAMLSAYDEWEADVNGGFRVR